MRVHAAILRPRAERTFDGEAPRSLDAIVGRALRNGRCSVSGRAAIRDEWRHILSIPDFANRSALTRVEIAAAGDLAYTMGTYVATMRGEDGNPATGPGEMGLDPEAATRRQMADRRRDLQHRHSTTRSQIVRPGGRALYRNQIHRDRPSHFSER